MFSFWCHQKEASPVRAACEEIGFARCRRRHIKKRRPCADAIVIYYSRSAKLDFTGSFNVNRSGRMYETSEFKPFCTEQKGSSTQNSTSFLHLNMAFLTGLANYDGLSVLQTFKNRTIFLVTLLFFLWFLLVDNWTNWYHHRETKAPTKRLFVVFNSHGLLFYGIGAGYVLNTGNGVVKKRIKTLYRGWSTQTVAGLV